MRKTLFRDVIYQTPFRYEYSENEIRNESFLEVWKDSNVVFSLTLEGSLVLTGDQAHCFMQAVKAMYCITLGHEGANVAATTAAMNVQENYTEVVETIRRHLKGIYFGEEAERDDVLPLKRWLVTQLAEPASTQPRKQVLQVEHQGALMQVEFADEDGQRSVEAIRQLMFSMGTGFAQLLSASNHPVPEWLKNTLTALKGQ